MFSISYFRKCVDFDCFLLIMSTSVPQLSCVSAECSVVCCCVPCRSGVGLWYNNTIRVFMNTSVSVYENLRNALHASASCDYEYRTYQLSWCTYVRSNGVHTDSYSYLCVFVRVQTGVLRSCWSRVSVCSTTTIRPQSSPRTAHNHQTNSSWPQSASIAIFESYDISFRSTLFSNKCGKCLMRLSVERMCARINIARERATNVSKHWLNKTPLTHTDSTRHVYTFTPPTTTAITEQRTNVGQRKKRHFCGAALRCVSVRLCSGNATDDHRLTHTDSYAHNARKITLHLRSRQNMCTMF